MLTINIVPGPDWFESLSFSDEIFINEKVSNEKKQEIIGEWLRGETPVQS